MRRITAPLGAVVAAGVLALGLTAPAHAANGDIRGDGWHITNPSGCYNVPGHPSEVRNNTDENVLVYEHADCVGRVIEVITPGGVSAPGVAATHGRSLYVS